MSKKSIVLNRDVLLIVCSALKTQIGLIEDAINDASDANTGIEEAGYVRELLKVPKRM